MTTRYLEIDALRGIAATSVMLYHFTGPYPWVWGVGGSLPAYELIGGNYGVELFFIISGFVIAMTLNRIERPLDFVVSRFSRLFPAFWFSVTFTFLIVAWLGLPSREVSAVDALINLTMLHDRFGVQHVDRVYWSLSVELGFYFLVFSLYLAGIYHHVERFAILWVGLQSTLILGTIEFGFQPSPLLLKAMEIKYAHYFVAGIMFFLIKSKGGSPLRHLVILGCWINAQMMHGYIDYISIEPLMALIFLTIFYLFVYEKLKWIAVNPILFMGAISYSLYLVHFHAGSAVIRQAVLQGWGVYPSMLAGVVFSVLCATAITYWVERPVQSVIRRHYLAFTGRARVSGGPRSPNGGVE